MKIALDSACIDLTEGKNMTLNSNAATSRADVTRWSKLGRFLRGRTVVVALLFSSTALIVEPQVAQAQRANALLGAALELTMPEYTPVRRRYGRRGYSRRHGRYRSSRYGGSGDSSGPLPSGVSGGSGSGGRKTTD